jgi:hypothetical protein
VRQAAVSQWAAGLFLGALMGSLGPTNTWDFGLLGPGSGGRQPRCCWPGRFSRSLIEPGSAGLLLVAAQCSIALTMHGTAKATPARPMDWLENAT